VSPPLGYLPLWEAPPATLPFKAHWRIPPGYVRQEKIRTGMVIGGSVTAASLWLLSSVVGSFSSDLTPLFIPVAGPFITIGTVDAQGVGKLLLVYSGLGQATGVGLWIAGLVAKKDVLVREDLAGLTVVPIVGANQTGLAARGSF
jgi:hypothetical protein